MCNGKVFRTRHKYTALSDNESAQSGHWESPSRGISRFLIKKAPVPEGTGAFQSVGPLKPVLSRVGDRFWRLVLLRCNGHPPESRVVTGARREKLDVLEPVAHTSSVQLRHEEVVRLVV